MIGRHNNLPIFRSNKFLRLDRWHRSRHRSAATVADDRTDYTGVHWIVEADTDDDEDGTEDGTN